jgi:uncharacterized membrane protein YczE
MSNSPRTTRPELAALSPVQQLRAGRLRRRLTQLMVGLVLYGVSMAMMVRGGLGLDPWDVLHFGVAEGLPVSFGTVVILVGIAVLLLWIPLRQTPGLGTVANAVVIGLATDAALAVMAAPQAMAGRIGLLLGGVVLNGLATALYIGSQLGPGPRDGLMTGLARRTGWSIRLVRTSIEVTVVLLGWLLGGVVGLGTVVYALSIGPLVQLMLPWAIVPLEPVGRKVSALRGDEDGGVGGHHHLDGGEPLVGQPLLTEHVDPTLEDRRPRGARREVVEHHDPAGLDEVDDGVRAAALGLLGVQEQQGERAAVAQGRPVRRDDLDLRVVLEDLGGRLGEGGVELGGEDAGVAADTAAQPRRAHAASRAELGKRPRPGRGQRRQQSAGLVATEGDVPAAPRYVESPRDESGELEGCAHAVQCAKP